MLHNLIVFKGCQRENSELLEYVVISKKIVWLPKESIPDNSSKIDGCFRI